MVSNTLNPKSVIENKTSKMSILLKELKGLDIKVLNTVDRVEKNKCQLFAGATMFES